MKPLSKALIVANLLVLLAFVGRSTWKNERLLREGELVLLELAPVDPRSLMQGDYMRLNYAAANVEEGDTPEAGYLIVRPGANRVGERRRLQAEVQPLSPGELAIPYRKRRWQLTIGAESYFFQEGRAADYERAKYGGLRVDGAGNALLVKLYDEAYRAIE